MKKIILSMIILTVMFLFSNTSSAIAPYAYPDSGTEVNSPDGTRNWNSETNIYTNNGLYASSSGLTTTTTYSEYLYASDFDIDTVLNPQDEITGIGVAIERKASVSDKVIDYHVRLVDSTGTAVGTDKKNSGLYWGTSEYEAYYGGADDLWSAGLDYNDFISTNFGVYLEIKILSNPVTGAYGYVDIIYLVLYINKQPLNSGNSPSNNSYFISAPALSITISDLDAGYMNHKFMSNYTGTWKTLKYTNNTFNATLTYNANGFYCVNRTFYWSSNLTDLGGLWDNDTFYLYVFRVPSRNLTLYNNHINTTWSNQYYYTYNDGFKFYDNDTGNLTPLHHYENIINATGTHSHKQNSTGYYIWANYTGNKTNLYLFENIINATGFHNYTINSTGYKVYANYTGNSTGLVISDNTVNTTGTIQYTYRPYTGVSGEWWVWINKTGILTPIHSYSNIVNATGTHFIKQNSTGYYDWANYTGNFSGGNISSFHIFLNLSGVIGFINWTGDISSNLTNLSFNVSSNMSIQGNADVNITDDFLYIAGFDITEPFLLLSILFALFYFWWKAESLGMMYVMAMLLIPYIIVVGIVYLLPLYIVDVNILLFVRLIFLMLSVGIGGFTIDRRAKSRKVGYEKKA
jgi:hypothetical protein